MKMLKLVFEFLLNGYFSVEWLTLLPAAVLSLESLVWGTPTYWQKYSLKLVDLPFRGPFFVELGLTTSQLSSDSRPLEVFLTVTAMIAIAVYFMQAKAYVLYFESIWVIVSNILVRRAADNYSWPELSREDTTNAVCSDWCALYLEKFKYVFNCIKVWRQQNYVAVFIWMICLYTKWWF